MGNSLFDQLQKSGLVDEKKAKKAKHGQFKNKKQKAKKGTPKPVAEATLLAQKAQAEKVERDRELNQQRKDEAERKAIAAQIKQLIEVHSLKDADGDIVYNFADANVVKRLYVSAQAHKLLVAGRLAIAKLGETYKLVPLVVAEKIIQRDAQCIIMCDQVSDAPLDEDDPYADYQIPDDLMW